MEEADVVAMAQRVLPFVALVLVQALNPISPKLCLIPALMLSPPMTTKARVRQGKYTQSKRHGYQQSRHTQQVTKGHLSESCYSTLCADHFVPWSLR